MSHEIDATFDAYEDELLAQAVGGAYGRGGERGARLLKKNVLEIRLDLSQPPDQVQARAFEAIGKPRVCCEDRERRKERSASSGSSAQAR